MVKCLITRLKAEVNNDSLPEYDVVTISVNLPKFISVYKLDNMFKGNGVQFKIVGDGYFCNSSGDADPNGMYISQGKYKIIIKNREAITNVNLPIGTANNWGNNDYISFSVEDLSTCKSMVEMLLYSQGVTGNIEVFKDMKSLVHLECVTSSTSGDLATLIRSYISNGRTSGSFSIGSVGQYPSTILFNGSMFRGCGAPSDSPSHVTWTSTVIKITNPAGTTTYTQCNVK